MQRLKPALPSLLLVATAALLTVPTEAHAMAILAAGEASWWSGIVGWLQQTQSDLWRGLAKAIRAVKEEGSITAASWLIGLSFFYGVVHAAGPGHGKAIISAYLVGNESAVRRGIGLSLLSAAAQGVTAILLVSVLAAFLGFISRDVAGVATWLETASAWVIVAIGAWFVARTVRTLLQRKKTVASSLPPAPASPVAHGHKVQCNHDGHRHGCQHDGHHHGHAHAVVTPNQARGWREGLAIVAAIGARPCMGAIFVLLFALAQGVFILGILGTAAMSLGTGITVAVLAALASGARATALKVAGSMDGWMDTAYHTLSLLGGLALVLVGLALAFQPPSAFPGAG
jgi:ABC-type nickel/cobalt efflux system permease component RcnA